MSRRALLLLWIGLLQASAASAQPLDPSQVPAPLAPWVPWVQSEHPERACAWVQGAARCRWPGHLDLSLDASGGRFSQQVTVDMEMRVPLPGNVARWPLDVRVDGRPAPVLVAEGQPYVTLSAGAHSLEGRFAWPRLPERLQIPETTAHVTLSVNGEVVAFPRRDEDSHLWLSRSAAPEGEGERLELTVHRRIEDAVPLRVRTRIELRVSGRAREVSLGKVLLPGTLPLSVDSDVPARLEPDGELKLQVRAGRYRVEIGARSEGSPEALAFARAGDAWPAQEVWVFAADDLLRQVDLSGAPGIDPKRTELDEDWHGLPTFLMSEGTKLSLKTTRRGQPEPPPNRLDLRRELWLDLDGRGYTVRDQLDAKLQQGFRLSLSAGELGRVSGPDGDLLITREGETAGVELRRAEQSLTAEWRSEEARGRLPAVGWSEDVQSVSALLHLGPGFRLLAADGVDSVSQSWVSDWDLFGFFFVLVLSLGIGRLCGRRFGALALVTLALIHHEQNAPYLVWLAVLPTIALLEVLPEGWIRRLTRVAFGLSAVTLLIIAVPFASDQIRQALYPQLSAERSGGFELGMADRARMAPGDGFAPDQMPAAPPMPAAVEAEPEMLEDDMMSEEAPVEGKAMPAPKRAARPSLSGRQYGGEADKLSRTLGALLQQDPEAVVQTGPGVPHWRFRSYRLGWSGPVARDHELTLYVLPPWATRLLSVLRVVLLVALLLVLLRRVPWKAPGDAGDGTKPAPAAAAAAALGLALTGAAWVAPGAAQADIPDQALLERLSARLAYPPQCRPDCVSTDRLELTVKGDTLSLIATVHAAERSSVRLPGPAESWMPSSVTLDGARSAPTARLNDGYLHVRVEPGIHRVRAEGPLPARDALTLALGDRPRRVTVQAEGWKVDGVREDGQSDGAIQLSRLLEVEESESLEGTALPPWLSLSRTFELGPTWQIHSTLERVSPTGTPLRVRVPLLPGESVTEEQLEVENGEVVLALGRDDTARSWTSSLKVGDRLDLVAAEGRPFAERWVLRCGPIWRCLPDGLSPVERVQAGVWEPSFVPWPGEKLAVAIEKPAAAEGQSVTIDSAEQNVSPGVRMQKGTLTLTMRASRGSAERVTLPPGAQLQSLRVDGRERPTRRQDGAVGFQLEPGEHRVELAWQRPEAMGTLLHVAGVDLHRPAANAALVVNVPDDRWLLWTTGAAWGPAILFWAYLVLVLLVAFGLGRTRRAPLSSLQWALLGLGLTQVPAAAALVVVGWFFVMAHRERRGELGWFAHDASQLGLIAWTLGAMGCLYAAVHAGLLMQPEMQVAGAGSSDDALRFYVDRSGGQLAGASVVSLPMWVWRVAMLAWSLWLAASLVRWLPWGFRCFRSGELWKKRPPKTPPPLPPRPAPEGEAGTGTGTDTGTDAGTDAE